MTQPLVIRRNADASQLFARWGVSDTLTIQRGVTTSGDPKPLNEARSETPAVWSLVLTTSASAAALAGLTVDVTFEVQCGVGSTRTSFFRTVTLAPATPSADVVLPFLPAATLITTAIAVSSMAPAAPTQIAVAALATPFGPSSFQV